MIFQTSIFKLLNKGISRQHLHFVKLYF